MQEPLDKQNNNDNETNVFKVFMNNISSQEARKQLLYFPNIHTYKHNAFEFLFADYSYNISQLESNSFLK